VVMPTPSSEPVLKPAETTEEGGHPRSAVPAPATDLLAWLRPRTSRVAAEWEAEIRARGAARSTPFDTVLARQILLLTELLPWLLGGAGVRLQPFWTRACELFGALATQRGLAAGEVVEEFQLLRRILIRDLYEDLPMGGAPSLRDALRLNGLVDRGVTHACVGHTDTLFFQLLGSGDEVTRDSADVVAREAELQLAALGEEIEAILGRALSEAVGSSPEGWTHPHAGPADA